MDDLKNVLSSLVSDRVRYYDLVKVTIHSYTRKLYILVADRAIYLVTYNLSGVLKDSTIKYDNIDEIKLNDSNDKVLLKSKKSLININDSEVKLDQILIDTPNCLLLYDKLKIGCDTYHMINNFKESVQDEEDVTVNNVITLLPFKGYKKVIFGDYYFFIKDSFKDTTFNTMYVTRLEDTRGVSISINIKDLAPIYHLELNDPTDLYDYSRGFLQEIKAVENQCFNDVYNSPYEILRDEVYYKKMKLNNDVSLWSGYHIVIRTNNRFIAFFILRRLYIPPLLDVCQDISIRFDCKFDKDSNINFCELWNEFCITVNSFTANSEYFIWNQDLIQMRVDNLRFDRPMYTFLRLTYGIVPSYYKLIKEFIGSLLNLLPPDKVDPFLISKFGSRLTFVDNPMEYIYRIITQIFGIGNNVNTNLRMSLINNFTMRLADYITFCIEELTNENLMYLLSTCANDLDLNLKKKVDEVVMFLMHFRSIDYIQEYKCNVFEGLMDVYKMGDGTCDVGNIIFNEYSVSCFLGYIGVLINNEDGYLKLLSMLIENFNDYNILKRIFRKLLEVPVPIPIVYLPLVPSLVNILKHQINSKLTRLLLSVLINFSFHGDDFKDEMISSHLPLVIVKYILYEDDIALLTLKLITNLTKCKSHQEAFVDDGIFSSLIILLENNYNRNCDIIAYSAGVIGQVLNTNHNLSQEQFEYITDVMIYNFHIGAGCIENYIRILFCLKKLLINKPTMIKIGRHCINTLIFNLKYVKDCDYVLNVFEMLYELAEVVYNCKLMKAYGIYQVIDGLDSNTDMIIQASIRLVHKIKKRHYIVMFNMKMMIELIFNFF